MNEDLKDIIRFILMAVGVVLISCFIAQLILMAYYRFPY